MTTSTNSPLNPDVAREYRAFLERTSATLDPYYSEESLRFEVRDDDVLVGPGDVSARAAACGVLFESRRANASFTVCGIDPKTALACLSALDGARTAREARAAANVPKDAFSVFIEGTFGKLVFVPLALAELERRVSHAEIVRFPGSPYEIVRAYWENMGDVRARIDTAGAALDRTDAFSALLSELNVLCHVGESGRSFYRPASPVVGKDEGEPGVFWRAVSVTRETPQGVKFVSGPRVGASLIGGERYQGLLARSVGDDGALAAHRELTEGGEPWGRIVTAKADSDEGEAPWFCPPRPIGDEALGAIRAAFSSARRAACEGRAEDAVRDAASLHWYFVRLHPFTSGNQSVAMGLVNSVLRPAFGAGMPHLVLDHLALRYSLPAYRLIFRRAVKAWLVATGTPVERALELSARRRRIFAFLEQLRNVPEQDAAAFVFGHGDDARLALLVED